MSTPSIIIWTDGACLGNPGPGGWAAIVKQGAKEVELVGAELHTTNNRMELMAVIQALKNVPIDSKIDLYSDSKYLIDGINSWIHNWQKNGWRTASKKPVMNQDLWKELINIITKVKIDWHWVKGHAGHVQNEICDRLAQEQAQRVAENI